jgi:hypothetical protein
MAAISQLIAARSEYAIAQLAKRDKNWAQREPGVIVVFVIVFLVACLLIGVFISKRVRRPNLPDTRTLSNIVIRSQVTAHKIPLSRGEEVDRKSRAKQRRKHWIPNVGWQEPYTCIMSVCTKLGLLMGLPSIAQEIVSRRSRGNEFKYIQ